MVHRRCVLVTSPVPVGSAATARLPRPLSRYTRPRAITGDTVSPSAAHHHSTLPLVGSAPCRAFDAAISSCFLPPTAPSTGVLWLKPTLGRVSSHVTAPVFLS